MMRESTFKKYKKYIHDTLGINLQDNKKISFEMKLNKLIEKTDAVDCIEYYKMLISGKNRKAKNEFLDMVTIHKTNFFRDRLHFDYMARNIEKIIKNNRRIYNNKEIKLWSAGCSSGEEVLSAAMVLDVALNANYDYKILGSDISARILKRALKREYPKKVIKEIPEEYLERYFVKTNDGIKVKKELMDKITYRQFNLMKPFPFSGKFDMVFCRNVMIFFSSDNQQKLIDKFDKVIVPGGLLFLGMAESLTNKKYDYKELSRSVYEKRSGLFR